VSAISSLRAWLSRSGVARWVGIAIGALAIGAVALTADYLRGRETTDDAFVEAPMVYLAAQVQGRVLEVLVQEHQPVEKGQLLVRLDPQEYELELERAKAALAVARNRLTQAEAASAATEAERKATAVELWRTERELKRVRSLREQGTVSQSDLDTARAARDAAAAKERALALHAEAERATLADEAPVREAEAVLHNAALRLERTQVRAPFTGFTGRRSVEPGAVVSPGQPLMALVREGDVWVVANFKETQLDRIRVGSRAEIEIDAFPGVRWRGHVESFSPATGAKYALIAPEPAAGNFTKVVQRVPVRIAIDGLSHDGTQAAARGLGLAAGLSAEVTVAVD
jgi:membrane fusion protein (multidrug efflux system)